MSCPDADQLLRGALGDLPRRELAALEAHAAGCPVCAASLGQSRALLEALGDEGAQSGPAASPDADEFTARVLAGRSVEAPRRAPRRALRTWLVAAAAGSLAALAVVPAVRLAIRTSASSAPGLTTGFTARGAAPRRRAEPLLSLELFTVRRGAPEPFGATLPTTATFAARYRASGGPLHLALFAIDARGDVHWLFPAYLDATADPASVPLVPEPEARFLPQIVQPEAPAPGPMRVVALATAAPVTVKAVEAKLGEAGAGASVERLFPGALVYEWRARWEATDAAPVGHAAPRR